MELGQGESKKYFFKSKKSILRSDSFNPSSGEQYNRRTEKIA